MTCQPIKDGFICGPNFYEFKGWKFEILAYCGAWPLTVNLEPRKSAGAVFWGVYEDFRKLSDADKEKCRI